MFDKKAPSQIICMDYCSQCDFLYSLDDHSTIQSIDLTKKESLSMTLKEIINRPLIVGGSF